MNYSVKRQFLNASIYDKLGYYNWVFFTRTGFCLLVYSLKPWTKVYSEYVKKPLYCIVYMYMYYAVYLYLVIIIYYWFIFYDI